MNQNKYFFCYNKKVSDYLNKNGQSFITVAIDPKSKKMYSLYEQNEELKNLLTEYKN